MKQDPHTPYLVMLLSQDLISPSGLGRYFPLAKYLVRENYRVTILALHSNFESETKRDFWDQGVHIRYESQMHVRKNENKTEYFSAVDLIKVSIAATNALLREAIKENPDLVFVGKPHPMNGIAGLMAANKKSIPLIVDCDDYEAESNKTSSRWQKALLRFFENFLPKKANLVTTNTYFNMDRLQKLGISSEKIHYLPNGVDTERFQPVSASRLNILRESLGLGDNKVVAYLGSLNLANHPVDLLIRSFAKVVKNQEAVRLLIVGGGGDMEKLQELVKELKIEESVVFTGRVQPDEINAYYQLADVSVDPVNDTLADRGRCPLKLFESWQMGVPVVTSDVGDRKVLAGEPPAVILTEAGSSDKLAEELRTLLKNPSILLHMQKNAIARAKAFDWIKISMDGKLVFDKLLK
ncbi:MAG: glycosyltransferase family 4 protein [Anaerolineaceae bacterium]|jgi:glycosyltransferase involved in cell wall biosynthesis|nr:glycosyltransferase family 4 protein [Anaerolineaceae bacterium]